MTKTSTVHLVFQLASLWESNFPYENENPPVAGGFCFYKISLTTLATIWGLPSV